MRGLGPCLVTPNSAFPMLRVMTPEFQPPVRTIQAGERLQATMEEGG
jgi:hypothetical protein